MEMETEIEKKFIVEANRQREKQIRGGGTQENWYSFRLSLNQVNEWLVDVQYSLKNQNMKKCRDIHCKQK